MENIEFQSLLLRTSFACMACDGDIDQSEVDLIKTIHLEKGLFGDIDIDARLTDLLNEINAGANKFLRNVIFLNKESDLTREQQIEIASAAIEMIEADNKIEYNEIKFFKKLRQGWALSNQVFLDTFPDKEDFFTQDILENSFSARLNWLQNEDFDIPQFEMKDLGLLGES